MRHQSTTKHHYESEHSGLNGLSTEQLAKQIAVVWGTDRLYTDNGLDSIEVVLCNLDPRLCKAPFQRL
jgi:hypothetical protein